MTPEFEAFTARKTAAAVAARLEPWRTDAVHDVEGLMAIGNTWSRTLFDGDFYVSPAHGEFPATSLVFVQSREGNTVANDPSSLGGGETDKHVVYEGLSRVAADAVMAGAETARGGRNVLSVWHPELVALRESLGYPRHPVQVVATLRGLPIQEGLLFNEPSLRVVLVTVPSCSTLLAPDLAARPWIELVVMRDANDLRSALRTLRRMGIARLSCVGGRTLARQLLDAGLVDDLYLTRSPRSGGEPNTPLHSTPLAGNTAVRKAGTGADTGVAFEQLRLTPTS